MTPFPPVASINWCMARISSALNPRAVTALASWLLCLTIIITATARADTRSAEQLPELAHLMDDGVIILLNGKFLKLQVCAEDIIRVACARDISFFNRKS